MLNELHRRTVRPSPLRIYDRFAAQNYARQQVQQELYAEPMMKAVKLEIPKANSLTDSLIKNSMGCEDR